MFRSPALLCFAGIAAGLALGLGVLPAAHAQSAVDEGFATGKAVAAWNLWQPAMQAILSRDSAEAEKLFGQLLELDPSPLRIALMADRTVDRTTLGGAILLLEQDLESKALEASGQRVAEMLTEGREQMNEADDGWYFSSLGRFDVANANFRALLDSKPDPVALLEFTDQVTQRRDLLLRLTDNSVVGEAVRDVMKALDRGEELIKADPVRIKHRIEQLAGPPRAYQNSVALLAQSGEWAVPFIVEYLRDPAKAALTQPILRALPQIGHPAVNPLVYAIRVGNPVVQQYLIRVLGQIGYAQALPYLLQLKENKDTPNEVLAAVNDALSDLAAHGVQIDPGMTAAAAFYALANSYYADAGSLAADPRLDTANVWFWRDGLVQNLPVPTQVFNEVMCMRCCEEALRLSPDMEDALALWLAADFRRVAQLGAGTDTTVAENFPAPLYFAQSAGTKACLRALSRALDDKDPAVALGVIEALRNIAGPASVTTDADGRLPLAEALLFPDQVVRIKAALTLGAARPVEPFLNHQNLMPVFAEALLLHTGSRRAAVLDPDVDSANAFAGMLREQGFEVVSDTEFDRGMQKVREHVPALDVIFLASNIANPPLDEALRQLRGEFRFSSTPVVLIAKPGDADTVRDLVRADYRLAEVRPGAAVDAVRSAIDRVSHAVGMIQVTPEAGTAIALDAAGVLETLAVTRNPLFDPAQLEQPLISALGSDNADLRLTAARVLAHVCSTAAQEAVAQIALDSAREQELRIQMFDVLAQAGKLCGSHLSQSSVKQVTDLAEHATDMPIRTAASQALGALNLPAGNGSQIIRNLYRE
jgi:tetratricopeptide (TPR) repeat protein